MRNVLVKGQLGRGGDPREQVLEDEIAIGNVRPVLLQRLADAGSAIVTTLDERIDVKGRVRVGEAREELRNEPDDQRAEQVSVGVSKLDARLGEYRGEGFVAAHH